MKKLFSSSVFVALFALHVMSAFAVISLPAGFIEQPIGSGWVNPVGVTFDTSGPNNRHYVWERGGKVWIVENGVKLATPMVDISEEVMAWRDFGMLGVALDPMFQQNGYIYLLYVVDRHHLLHFGTPSYSATANINSAPSIGRITRYTARASDGLRTVDPASRRVLVGEAVNTGFPILHESHGTGALVFGTDGTLLAACGDGASYSTTDSGGAVGGSFAVQARAEGVITVAEDVGAFRSQLLSSLNGKIIRIDPATGDAISSNPYFNSSNPRSAASRVWALGLRNPYRMSLRPDTGSHNRNAANPGTIYLGDVGYGTREDVHVVDGPGLNCGWPLYEGLDGNVNYQASSAVNLDAPNPLGGFFKFRDLLIQDTLGTPSWPNPANPAQQVPGNIAKWVHSRPILDYSRAAGVAPRTGIFVGNAAATSAMGTAGSPVAGPVFNGNTSTGGVFFHSEDFPEQYHGTYFHADVGGQWIKNIVIGANDRPTEVRPFASGVTSVVFVTTHPTTGGLYYVNFGGAVQRIVYAPGGNQPPVVVGTSSPNYGPSPLTVQFTGTGSYDADGATLGYLWTFDDGTTSTAANPMKTFTATGTRKFNVTLRVTDSGGATATDNIPVFVNHAPPVVNITSPVDGAKYPVGVTTTYPLSATITPQPGHPASSTWQTILHHEHHTHEDPPIAGPNGSVRVGGDGEGFYYANILSVTDDLGLTVNYTVNLFPNLGNIAPAVAWTIASKQVATGTATVLSPNATASDSDSPDFGNGELRVEVIGGGTNESLSIRNEGNGAGQIGLSGANVTFGGVVIGTLSIANNRTPLVISFNTSATPAAAQAALRNVAYLSTVSQSTARTIRATLKDGDGGTSTAANLAVTSTGGNLAPTVSITSPSVGALFTAPANVVITADAADADGTVTKVEFYRGSTKIGEDTTAPYAITWANAPAGTFNLRARATDNRGTKVWSTYLQIRVTSTSTSLLVDDFNDNARDTVKWTLGTIAGTIYSGASAIDLAVGIVERNQRLEIPLRAGQSGDRFNGYVAATARDFTDASASVEVVQVGAGFSNTMLGVSLDRNNFLLMVVEAGELYLDHTVFGGRNATGLVFNPVAHRFWRIRHVAATRMFVFEASPDGVNWQTLRRDNVQFAVTALRPEISAGTWLNEAAPGMAVFDNFKMERGGAEPPAPANEAPIADPGGPYAGIVGQPVTLDGGESLDFDGTVAGYSWTFGDGTTGSGVSVAKTYATAGNYTVLLRATDDLGAFSEETTTVAITTGTVPNQPPVARPGGPYSGIAGTTVAMNGNASTDADGTIATYAWTFGDGTTGTGATVSKTYAAAGSYTVTLTVTDNLGATHSATTTATITAPVNQPPVARPDGPYSGVAGTAVAINGSASTDADGTIATYAWTCGDGTTGTGATVSKTYAAAGSYTVTLTVTDNLGATHSATATATITIAGGGPTTLIADDFNDNTRDALKWRLGAIMGTIYEGAGAADPLIGVFERNGRLEIVPRVNTPGDRYYGYMTNALDLTAASARVQCVQVPGGSANALLSLTKDSQNFLLMGYESGFMFFDQTIAGHRDYALINYNAAQHRHWRIRHNAVNDTIVFETSPDGATWTAQRTTPRRLPMSSITVELSGGSYQPESNVGTVVFDNFAAERP